LRARIHRTCCYTSRDLSVGLTGTRWWLGQPEFHDAAGHVINNAIRGAPQQAAYFVQYYQPGDRFWATGRHGRELNAPLTMTLSPLTEI